MHQAADSHFDKVLVEKMLAGGVDYNAVDASAISLETIITVLTSGGAETRTLANGREGQIKILQGGITVTGAITITPSNLAGYATVVIAAAGRGAGLFFSRGEWHVFALGYATLG